MKKATYNVINGRKGGRPGSDTYITAFSIPGISTVILTEHQYNTLLERYGFVLFEKALKILDEWLKSGKFAEKHKGRNNYALFRADGWVINMAKLSS